MFGSIVRFELRYQLHQPAFYACLVAFALVGYLVAIAAAMATDAIKVNAPSSFAHTFVWFSLFGAFVLAR